MQTFDELSLKPEILKAVKDAGYKTPMRIQIDAIPVALEGRDLIGCAQTGTGKTAAFVLPILQLMDKGRRPQALILAPTRELAIQIGDSITRYAKYLPVKSTTVYGGVPLGPQIRTLRRGVDILVATPGRLLDHVRRGNVSLKPVRFLVLDEADRMLDMGFLPDVEQIIQYVPARQQTMLFSATMPPEIRRLASRYMNEVVRIDSAPPATPASGITHRVYAVPKSLKNQLLVQLLHDEPVQSALIFTRTRRGADHLSNYLERKSMSVARLHSDRTQGQRQRALKGFRNGEYKILVATDIAARGLDIPTVSHVFHYDLPENADDYVHRSGRTARAEGTGFAFCLMAPEEIDLYNALETQIGQENFAWASHPGFDYLSEPKEASFRRDHDRRARGGSHRSGRGGRSVSRSATTPRRGGKEKMPASQPVSQPSSQPSSPPPATRSPFGRRRTRAGHR